MADTVLPHLLQSGVLCRFQAVIVEWHLNGLETSKRLAGLGLRLSPEHTLRQGCGRSPRLLLLEQDEYAANNFGLPVPDLMSLALRHNASLKAGRIRVAENLF